MIIHPGRPVDLAATVRSHGWVMLAPWQWDGHRLVRSERFGDRLVPVSVRQTAPDRLEVDGPADVDPPWAEALIRRWLSLDWDADGFLEVADSLDPELASFVRVGGGRFLRGSSFFEDFAKTVCTINTTWPQTIRMVAGLVEMGGGAFPTPAQMLAADAELLKTDCRLGFRARTLLGAVQRMLADNVMDGDGRTKAGGPDHDYLLSLKGIGPYAAAHCRMLLHDFSRLPVDSVVAAYLQAKGVARDDFLRHFTPWGRYAFLGYKLRRLLDAAAPSAGDGR